MRLLFHMSSCQTGKQPLPPRTCRFECVLWQPARREGVIACLLILFYAYSMWVDTPYERWASTLIWIAPASEYPLSNRMSTHILWVDRRDDIRDTMAHECDTMRAITLIVSRISSRYTWHYEGNRSYTWHYEGNRSSLVGLIKWYSTPSPNLSPNIFLGLDPSPPPLS